MIRNVVFAVLLSTGLALAAGPARVQPETEVETPDVFPAGDGQEETFYICTACHSSALVRQQGLSRDGWDRLIDFMMERHNMAPLDAVDRKQVVDYLAQHFPPRRQGGFRNPFLKQ